MEWKDLLTSQEKSIGHGTVFRLSQADWPYEKTVDFMLVNEPDSPSRHRLIVATGYKAGHIVLNLPAEAKCEDVIGIRVDWLKEHWKYWINEFGPEGVKYTRNYVIGEVL